ncbi:MAG: DUF3373 domain-containing protein [Thiovulaceae bacterium]|nr:DUF3373 domain-containing protein [Sulfurimonadaceae bacterium]
MKTYFYLLISFTLFSQLQAETFFDRFKVLEDKVQEIGFEIDNMKSGTPNAKIKASPNSQPSTKLNMNALQNIESMKASIRSLEFQQRQLIKELLILRRTTENKIRIQSTPYTPTANISSTKDEKKSSDDWDDDEEDDEDGNEENNPNEMIKELEEIQNKLAAINQKINGNNMKVSADFRTAVDAINYTMADGSTQSNSALFTNRLWLNFKYQASQNSSFIGQLAYYKSYGARTGTGDYASMSAFDWVVNTRPSDDAVRVKQAYWFYSNNTFLGTSIPWTFSLGRRPSTNGHLANLREDDTHSSPLAHFVNVEFDGGSSKFDFSEMTGIDGLYLKFCFGRGQTNAAENFSSTPYATSTSGLDQIDMIGLIISLYDDKQYALKTQTVQAWNLFDLVDQNISNGFETVGDISNFTVHFSADGIGNDWSHFLDQTTFFASYSISSTSPHSTKEMLGSASSQTASSYWVGIQMPTWSEKGKFGLEFNHGDKYWRSFTYAEDTMAGSKIAARGDAYEVYWTEYIDKALSWQIRYTYIDYDYSGSNGFFGGSADGLTGTGTPFSIAEALAGGKGPYVVDKVSDLRFYIRYRY